MAPYRRKVQYYETDRMGITHHSRYILWMEEARIGFLERMGFPYAAMEERGVVSPVKGISCDYRRSTTFGDEVEIAVSVASVGGASLELRYDMRDAATGETVFTGSSKHVFLDSQGRILRLKRDMQDFYETLAGICENK